MIEFLATSQKVHAKLRNLFATENRRRRRVACVAYVGVDAPSLLPDFRGVELYCWPQPGSTDPGALSALASPAFGAKVFVSDHLHAKLFWVEGIGYVVTSANLSTNALGELGLREVGVFIDKPDQVDINAFIRTLNAHPIEAADLRKLHIEHDRFWAAHKGRARLKVPKRTFEEWYQGARLPAWRIAWWDAWGHEHKSTAIAVRTLFNVDLLDDFIPCLANEIDPGDWVLCYFVKKTGRIGEIAWLYADYVHALTKTETRKDFTHEAVQLRRPRAPMRAPFVLTAAFQKRFRETAHEYGVVKLQKDSRPPAMFLRALAAGLPNKRLKLAGALK